MRFVCLFATLAFGGCLSIVRSTGGGSSGVASTSAGTPGSSGSTGSGSGNSSAASTSGTSSGTTSGASLGGGSSNGGPVLPAGPCGPGTTWLGDVCVTTDCAYPVTTTAPAGCALEDGGLGYCSNGACLVAGDPNNCGGRGLLCPAPALCMQNSYCASPDAGPNTPYWDCSTECPGPNLWCSSRGNSCVESSCAPGDDDAACVADGGYAGFCCEGQCVTSAPGNCGGCGITCPQGSACNDGICVPTVACGAEGAAPFGACPLSSGTLGMCCGSECVDLGCGVCGIGCLTESYCFEETSNGCDAGYACALGIDKAFSCLALSCTGQIDGSACYFADAGTMGICRAGTCGNIADAAHCGVTGAACGAGEYCYQQQTCRPFLDCALGGGLLDDVCLTAAGTPGSCCGSRCVDTTSDSRNCYVCGTVCPVGSACQVIDGAPDCRSDAGVARCGSDTDCPADSACVESFCQTTICDGTGSFCSYQGGLGSCCGSTCGPVQLECGGSCPAGAVLSTQYAGCSLPDGGLACTPDAVCPEGTICSTVEQSCIPFDVCAALGNSSSGVYCPLGRTQYFPGICCEADCIDTTQDPLNCFGCGVVCPSGICAPGGDCLPAGPTDDCNASCGPEATCLRGQCIDASCANSPYCLAENGSIGLCCGNGACAHPLDDPQNCGLCGNDCGPGAACVNGSCTTFPGCGLGRMNAFCDLDAGPFLICCPSLGCHDVSNDPNNCGFCGNPCIFGGPCVDGVCAVGPP